MDEPAANGARAAARRLGPHYGPALPDEVEAALYAGESDPRPGQYGDPVSVASLIVSTAAFAWTVYNDLKSRRADPPSPELVARTVTTQLQNHRTLTGDHRTIITITVEETIPPTPPPDHEEATP